MLCYGGGDVLRPSAYKDEHGGTKGKELTQNQRRNKKECIIRKKGRKRKETEQFSPIFKFLNPSFSLFQTQH
jgi:hypothetical protein